MRPCCRGGGLGDIAAWKDLIGRHSGFFNYDPETLVYCMITAPAPWRDTPDPTWQLVAAMMRNQRRQFSEQPPPGPVQAPTPTALTAICRAMIFSGPERFQNEGESLRAPQIPLQAIDEDHSLGGAQSSLRMHSK